MQYSTTPVLNGGYWLETGGKSEMILFVNLNERWKRAYLDENIREVSEPYEYSGPGFVHEYNTTDS